jgi:hypothetical protein
MNVFGNNKVVATVCAFVMLFALFQFANAANATVNSSNNSTLKITSFTSSAYVISGDQNVSFFNVTSGGTGSISYYYTLCGCGNLIDHGNNHFSFSNTGSYTLELTVQDQSGETNQSFLNITVEPVLKITSFTANTYLISGDQRISLYNQTSGGTGGISYYYTLCGCANGSLVNYGNNEFGFSQPGTYFVQLYITDLSGETNQSTIKVQVNNTLETTLFANVTTVTEGQDVLFSNQTSGGTGGNKYMLSVNNTNGTTVNNNGTVAFTSPGSYAVTLNVTDQSGEFANSTAVITVLEKPVVTGQALGGGIGGTTAGIVFSDSVSPSSPFSITQAGECLKITNVELYQDFNFSLSGNSYSVADNFIGSNYTSIVVNGVTYTLAINSTAQVSSSPFMTMELTGVSYQQTPRTVSLLACPKPTTSISVDLTLNSNTSTVNNVTPSGFEGMVSVSGAPGVKSLPGGYVGLFIGNISVNSTTVKTINLTIQYQCNLNNNGTIEPYMLQNGVWTPISQFVLNSTACSVSLTVPADPIIALVQQAHNPSTLNPTAAPTPSEQRIIVHPMEPVNQNNDLVMIIAGVAMVAAVLMIVVRPNRPKAAYAKSKNTKRNMSKK